MLLATRRDTTRLGAAIARALEPGDLVLLDGDLGAGKTFLARGILRALGIDASERVASPTFSLVHEYRPTDRLVVHADLYRLLDDRDALTLEVARLGIREQRRDGAIVLCEWGRDVESALGGAAQLVVRLSIAGASSRLASLEGPRAAAIGAIP